MAGGSGIRTGAGVTRGTMLGSPVTRRASKSARSFTPMSGHASAAPYS